jgi:uncharacterized membrane protein YeaQ/YmgE (transglycosylase-associated protein family)
MSSLRTAPATGRTRRTVATFGDYAEAQRAVDHLSDNGFPVDRVAIVGRGLRYVEQVAGRMTTGRAALAGAAQGAFVGALFGLLASLIFTLDPDPAIFLLVLYGIVAGALFGAILGAAMHLATGGERDFTSVSGLTAETFDIQVDDDVADRAAELLRALGPARTAG